MSETPAAQYDLIAVTGRYQPFHNDHLALLLHALSLATQLIVAITNPDQRSLQPNASSKHRHLAASNPFTFFERLEMITAALDTAGVASGRYRVVPFPLDAPGIWPDYVPQHAQQLVRVFADWERDKAKLLHSGGYDVITLKGDTQTRISASDIRAAIGAGDTWSHWVPGGTRDKLQAMDENDLRRRCLARASAGNTV